MKQRLSSLLTLAAVAVLGGSAFAAGVLLSGSQRESAAPRPVASVTVAEPAEAGERRPDFTLPDHEGHPRSIGEWDGKLVILNFWATWCPPCLHEIPQFIELQAKYAERGVQFVGVAIDEQHNVRDFVAEVGLNYPTVHGQMAAIDLIRAYGNATGALPYTVVIDRDGTIVHRHAGEASYAEAEAWILPRL